MNLSDENIKALVSGAASGLICDMVMHPVDTVRTRLIMQTKSSARQYKGTFDAFASIVRHEGVSTLYKGAGVVWSFTVPAHALYFFGYEAGKRYLEPNKREEDKSALTHFGAGLMAELGGALIWTPMDVIKQRQQVQSAESATAAQYATVRAAVGTIVRDQGVMGLFKGFGAALATYGPFVGLYFVIYEQFKRASSYALSRRNAELPFGVHLCGGAVAGAVAAYVTTPLDVIKTRFQTTVDANGRAVYNSAVTAAKQTLAKDGPKAFFKGASARVLWIAPGTAITIAAYERVKRLFEKKSN